MSGLPEMPCAELVERITDHLEGALPPADRARLEEHLATCPPCRRYLEQLAITLRLTGELRVQDLSSTVRDDLLAVFSQWQHSR